MKAGIHNKSTSIFKVSILAVLMLTFSCTQDSVLDGAIDSPEELNAQTAKSENGAQAKRVIRGKLNNKATTDPGAPAAVTCFETAFGDIPLTTNNIFGNMTHLGKIQAMSYGVPVECIGLDPETFTIESIYNVNYIGAHGDAIHTVEHVFIWLDPATEFTTGTFDGTIKIMGGTGRFAEATGWMNFVDATFVGDESTWGLVGEITY